jgi:hypothetical protein
VDGVGSAHAEQHGYTGQSAVQVEQCARVAAGDHHAPGLGVRSQEGDQVIEEPAVRLLQVELHDGGGSRAVPGFGKRRPLEYPPGQLRQRLVPARHEPAAGGDHVDLDNVGSVPQCRG